MFLFNFTWALFLLLMRSSAFLRYPKPCPFPIQLHIDAFLLLLNVDTALDFLNDSPDAVPEGANIQWEVELIDFEKNKVCLKHYHLLDENPFTKNIALSDISSSMKNVVN